METAALRRIIAAFLCLSVVGLPLTGTELSLCLAGTMSFQHDAKHEGCRCASATCKDRSCCCGHHQHEGLSTCRCGGMGHVSLLGEVQSGTAGQNSLRAPISVEAVEEALYLTPFVRGGFSYSLDYGGMGVLLRTCSLRS